METVWMLLQYGLGIVTLLCLLWALMLLSEGEAGFFAILVVAALLGCCTLWASHRRQSHSFDKSRIDYLKRNPQIGIALTKTDSELALLEKAVAAITRVKEFGSTEESRKYAIEKIARATFAMEELKKTKAALVTEVEKQIVLGDGKVMETELGINSRRESLQKSQEALQAAAEFRRELGTRNP